MKPQTFLTESVETGKNSLTLAGNGSKLAATFGRNL